MLAFKGLLDACWGHDHFVSFTLPRLYLETLVIVGIGVSEVQVSATKFCTHSHLSPNGQKDTLFYLHRIDVLFFLLQRA